MNRDKRGTVEKQYSNRVDDRKELGDRTIQIIKKTEKGYNLSKSKPPIPST